MKFPVGIMDERWNSLIEADCRICLAYSSLPHFATADSTRGSRSFSATTIEMPVQKLSLPYQDTQFSLFSSQLPGTYLRYLRILMKFIHIGIHLHHTKNKSA